MGRAGRPTRFPKIKRVGGRGGRRKSPKQVSVVLGRSIASSTRAPPPRRTVIPSLDPITRRRSRGLSDLPRRAKPRPIPQFGTDFGVLQPFGGQRRKPVPRGIRKGGQKIFVSGRRPSRVTVQSPSERRDRLITVSSRSRLAREESVRRRDRRPDVFRTGARGKQVKVKQKRPIRVPRRPRPRSDFDLGNIFDVQF